MSKITEFKFIPTTETSKPFAAAAEKCCFDKIGYIEDEYFQTGTANVYDEDAAHNLSVKVKDAPYTTRVIIRRPADVTKFSGNVVLEILNSSANIDIDRMWVDSWPLFTRNGDIYVGISSKGHVVDSMKAFDAERYAPINWNNPDPDTEIPEAARKQLMPVLPQYELGLFWDMLIDLSELLKCDCEMNPLREYGKIHLYLTGWSQSTFYVNRMVRCFLQKGSGREDLYDGFLNGGGGASMAPLNNTQSLELGDFTGMTSGILGAAKPFIAVNTESDSRMANFYGDFDEPDFKFRAWEIAGTSHDSNYNLVEYYGEADLKMLESIGIYNAYYGVDGEPLDTYYEAVFSAAWKALYAWSRDGVPAPHAPRFVTERTSEDIPGIGGMIMHVLHVGDAFGNTRGGIRTPAVDVPTSRICYYCTYKDGTINGAFGKEIPFSAAFLKELYGSLENYRKLADEAYTRTVSEGFLLEEDREEYLRRLTAHAAARGLE